MGLQELYETVFDTEVEDMEKTAEEQEVDLEQVAAGRFMARGFADEMEKIAIFGDAATAIGGWSKKGKESSRAKAEASAELVADAVKARRGNIGQYLLNPAVPGPVSEVINRLKRRHRAAAAENPHATGWVPFFGIGSGGKAGLEKIKKAERS